MKVERSRIPIRSRGFSDVIDITPEVSAALKESEIANGLLTVFIPGSTGTITTIEYEEGVIEDLKAAVERIAPSNIPYKHDQKWGDGNGFSHVRAALMKPDLTIPVLDGRLMLGTWQQIVFIDFDNRARSRELIVQILGESSPESHPA